MVYVITFLATLQLPVTYACVATPPAITPTSTTVRPSTPIPTPICCQPLSVSLTNNTNLSNGIMSFIYSSSICRALAIATCSQPTVTPPLQLFAGITVNRVNFINIQPGTVSYSLNFPRFFELPKYDDYDDNDDGNDGDNDDDAVDDDGDNDDGGVHF
ncbi:unnamed protein product [Litomosoides sigmodontis]|uniref:Pherophorin domain-containing protein n=1 Tax=Litomosoides sigmodontis TaxID=42156 RepID=A0A3P6ULF3_LITSI|nr:unnamed protein product [Litomosoides sigmodontis]